MNGIRNNWRFSLEEQGELTLNKVAGISKSVGQISNDVTKAQLLMADLNVARRAIKTFFAERYNEKNAYEQYKGLEKDPDNIIKMSYAIENAMYDEMLNSRLYDACVKKFLYDYCKVGRMRQELTIDYAKKLTDLSGIDSLLTERIKAMGLLPHTVSFDTREGIVNTKYPTVEELVAEQECAANPKIIFEDSIHKMQMHFMGYTKRLVENEGGLIEFVMNQPACYPIEDAIQEEMQKQERDVFLHIKNIYKDIVGGMTEKDSTEDKVYAFSEEETDDSDVDFNDKVARIENMLRMATQNMSPEERACKIKTCSRRGDIDEESGEEIISENKFYLHICKQEYLLWLLSLGLASCEYIGERLYDESDEEHRLQVGDTIHFENGECDDGIHNAFIEVDYTGDLMVFKKDFTLYAGKSMKDAITVPSPDNKILIKVLNSYGAHCGSSKKAFELINNRMHNKCRIVKREDAKGKTAYYMVIRTNEDKQEFVPVYIHKDMESYIVGKKGTIVNTTINDVRGNNDIVVKTIYISIDLDTDNE
jgi:hypothetical protein